MRKEHILADYEIHRLPLLKDVIYIYEYSGNGGKHKLTMEIPEFGIIKTVTGMEAKTKYNKLTEETWDALVKKIISMACYATGVDNIAKLYKRNREKEVVFARNCVWWHCYTYFQFTQQECADMFDMSHSNVLHGIRDFKKCYNDENNSNPDIIFQTRERRLWVDRFIKKCKEQYQIDSDIFNPRFIIKDS